MLSKVQAKSIADAQSTGATVDGSLLDESPTGKQLMDNCNHAILWAAKNGGYTAPVDISLFQDSVITQAISDLTTLGYNVDQTRRPGYKELILGWA